MPRNWLRVCIVVLIVMMGANNAGAAGVSPSTPAQRGVPRTEYRFTTTRVASQTGARAASAATWQGCQTIHATMQVWKTYPISLFNYEAYETTMAVSWCWGPGDHIVRRDFAPFLSYSLTVSGRFSGFGQDGSPTYATNWYSLAGRSWDSGYHIHGDIGVHQCFLKYGCVWSGGAWMEFNAHGNGTYSFGGRGDL